MLKRFFMILLVIASFMALLPVGVGAGPNQPPVDTTTLYVGHYNVGDDVRTISPAIQNPPSAYGGLDDVPWGVKRTNAWLVHPYNKGAGIKVAILDDGVDYNHPDLKDNCKQGRDFVDNDDMPLDESPISHGTKVAGIIGAGDNGFGIVGMAPRVNLYPVRGRTIADATREIDWCIENEMDIISMSWIVPDDADFRAALTRASNAGILLIAAVPNIASEANQNPLPWGHPDVIAVASIDKNNKYVPDRYNGSKIFLSAPGQDINSTVRGGTFEVSSGTWNSYATPHVTGAAALLWSTDHTLTHNQVKTILQNTAVDLGPPGRDDTYGYGLVDALAACNSISHFPRRADPSSAYDTSSRELIFNTYDTLIEMGQPVTNAWGTWYVGEQYLKFSPSLSTNVPTRVQVIDDFNQISFAWTIVVKSELPYPFPLPIGMDTWWQDALPQPFNSYHITDWIDTNQNGILDPSDLVFTNDYWWAPTPEAEIVLEQVHWWHVADVQDHGQGLIYLVLQWVPDPAAEPLECYWFTSPKNPNEVFHFEGYVDSRPDGILNFSDVVYLKEYAILPVVWEKIGPGFTYLPITARTYHVLDAVTNPPISLHVEHFCYDFNIRTVGYDGLPIKFFDNNGAVVDEYEIDDVEYSFERSLVQDQYNGPIWLLYEPLFGQMNSDFWSTTKESDMIELSYLIKDAIEIFSRDPPVLRINLGKDFSDVNFKQILSQTWSAIVSKEWSIGSKGAWNGDLFLDINQNCVPDWWEAWRRTLTSPLQTVTPTNYAGTGPYHVLATVAIENLVLLERNPSYWKRWPAPNKKDFLEEVWIEYMEDWASRREAFKAGQLDIAAISQSLMMELLNPNDPTRMRVGWGSPFVDHPEIITIKDIGDHGRKWMTHWVKGWYYNPLYPSDYYYRLYKEHTCWGDVVGAPPSSLPDGVVNMRDVGYIAGHFGVKAPDPSNAESYDIRWAPGTYGISDADLYGDRKVDMRDIGCAAAHFGHSMQP